MPPSPHARAVFIGVFAAAVVAVASSPAAPADAADAPRLRGLDLYRPVPDDNPLTAAKVDLGRRLFSERRFSRDGSRACDSCHDPGRAFTNGERFGNGMGGALGTRNVPALLNRAWGRSFFWDGRAATLEDQVLQPIVHPDELAMSPAGIVAVTLQNLRVEANPHLLIAAHRQPLGTDYWDFSSGTPCAST